MGEIADALRRARAEREAAGKLEPAAARPVAELARAGPGTAPVEPAPAEAETAEIPSARSGFWQARAMASTPPGAVTERYRHLALRVRRELERRGCRTLLVTSALRQEGKTVTACNLAMALASLSSGGRVALVDLDLRRPSVARGLGLQVEEGIDTVLRGQAPLARVCHPTNVPNLDVLPAAKATMHAHELLATERFARVVGELAERYALVVADTPPVLLVPDVPLVMPHFGACLFVVRTGRTSRSNMEEALSLLPREQLIGVAMNEAQLPSHGGQYGYYTRPGEHEDAPEEDEDEAPRWRRRKRP